jgi:hypothetical protein
VAALADILTRVRLELGDNAATFTTTLTGDGATKSFYMNYKPVDAAYLEVKINGVAKANPTDFTVEENIGVINFVTAPALYDNIVITGTHYRYFTTSELTTFVNTAVLQHTDNRTDSWGSNVTISNLPPVEEYPLALLATVEALWALATDAAFDINISAPDGVAIPRGQRFQQLSGVINARKEQYRELCSALNVGLWRIEIGTLRRVSRTTNRLVPVYIPQEIDDSTQPERVYIENNLKGRTPLPSNVGVYDIVLTQGDVWSVPFDFPLNLNGYLVKAQARTYPGSPIVAAEITCTITDVALGKVTLSLTHNQTLNLPLKCFWDLQVYKADGSFNETYIRGLVFANRQVTDESSVSSVPMAAPTFTASTPPAGTRTVAYSYQFLATGPDPVFFLQAGALPTGLSLGSTGLLSGTPTTTGTYTFTIRVYNSGMGYSTAQTTLPLSSLYTDLAVSVVIS